MSEPESQGKEPSRDMAGEARERANRLRAQAELAWSRVQEVSRGKRPTTPSLEGALRAARQLPIENYLFGASGSLLIGAWLQSAGHRRAGFSVGFLGPLALVVGLLAKLIKPRETAGA